MKRRLTIVASVLMAASLLAPVGATQAAPAGKDRGGPSPGSYTPPAPDWGECTTPRLVSAGAECALVDVPLDWDRPRGEKIQIAVSRVLHTDPDYKGMIAVNPGGPGGSGLIYSVLGGAIPDGVGAKYDWYGFDPRGVGSSVPALSCDPDYAGAGYDRPNYVPKRLADLRWWKKTTEGYARACGRSAAKELLPHMRTEDAARDLDAIRAAVGQKKLNYYGFSYGTYLGQVYATLFPKRVGNFVWDGVLDAKKAFYEANLEQNVQFDKNLDTYFKWLADNDAAFGLGTDWREIKRGYYRLRKQLDRQPAADGRLGPDELDDSMLSAAYYVYGWVEIGQAYATLVNTGDGDELLSFYGGPGDDNGYAVYNAVQCTDAPWPGWRKTKWDAWMLHRKYPFLTWGNTWYNAPCLTWPARSGKQFKVNGSKVKSPILMIGETYDAATVFSGALATRKRFRTSYLIEGVGGTTHSGSLSGIACVDDTVASFLDTGVLPERKRGRNRSDQLCEPVPAPDAPAPAGLRSSAPSTAPEGVSDRMPADLREGLEQAQSSRR
ncbi:alpha/beta fold hydrolase [Nocardioides gilvus]|uniref:alpha/beta fold hydrolase n=1 Tax=Nocardioides gilvus TaxID=1735589 RepID=UPI0013A585EC|nr:alpha/beta fold hydrolase [Nocardioides gilvus]